MVCDPLWPPIAKLLKRSGAFRGVRGAVVAASGGPDSTALLHVLKTEGLRTFPELKLTVAHLNHGFRGDEANEDARFVAEFADSLNLPCFTEKTDVRAAAAATKKNLEATARTIRYEFLVRTARACGAEVVATGHTMTDQAETVLMRLLRGTSPDGAASMRPVRRVAGGESVRIVRPLLDVKRDAVEAYLARHGLVARLDSTNDDVTLRRNFVRNRLWPLLEEFNPRTTEALAGFARLLSDDADSFTETTERWVVAHARQIDAGIRIPINEFKHLPPALRGRVVHRLLMSERFPAVSREQIQRVVELFSGVGGIGKKIELPGGRIAERTRDEVILTSDEKKK